MSAPDRKAAEKAFFNDSYGLQHEQGLNGFYERSGGVRAFAEAVLRDCAGRRVLEYGCGTGGHAFRLADRGADVTGIDISDVAVERARQRIEPSRRLRFEVADAEALPFADASFDLVCGTSILHHLDIAKALQEVRRVLAPGGRAVFYEPVGYNPAANLYRRLTPQLHTEDEHPLLRSDFALMRREFRNAQFRFFDLFSVGAIPLLRLPGGVAALRVLEAIDRALLAVAPPLRLLANVVVIELMA
jgi:SAM-dependent methyltransferase